METCVSVLKKREGGNGAPRITVTKIIIYIVKCRARILKWIHTNAAWDSIELLVDNMPQAITSVALAHLHRLRPTGPSLCPHDLLLYWS